jgi:signal transduction histidine kinase
MVGVVGILALAVVGAMPALELVVMAIVQGIALVVAIAVARAGLRATEIEKKVIAIASLGLLLVLARDAFVLLIRPYSGLFSEWGSHYGEVPWSRFGWLAFSVAMAWTLAERLRRDGVTLKQAKVEMWQRLALQKTELNQGFTGQLEERQKQGRLDERHRLMRDMHDGLGSHLLGALQLARDPTANRARIKDQLEAALDMLKLTVDAMHDVEGDVGSLLGALRYRLGPRLDAGGIQLSWMVQELPCIADWSVDDSRDLQMIMYEGISNIILHAGATHVTVAAHHEAVSDLVVLRLTDDGCGFVAGSQALNSSHPIFSPSGTQARAAPTLTDDLIAAATVSQSAGGGPQRRGRGLSNIELRARRLGALLRIHSSSAGTTLELSLARCRV